MKLLFKQRIFSWFDSYDISYEGGDVAYSVRGKLSWGHKFVIEDESYGRELGVVKERVFTFLPKFDLYIGGNYVGCICKEFSFFTHRFTIDFNGWQVDGDFWGWDYRVVDSVGNLVATVSKELFRFSDTYAIDVVKESDALAVLMLVLAIDAEKCTRNK